MAPAHRHDSVGGQVTAPVGPDAVDADRAAVDDPDARHPGVGEQREVGAVQRRLQEAPPGPTRVPPLMFSGTAPTPGGSGPPVSNR